MSAQEIAIIQGFRDAQFDRLARVLPLSSAAFMEAAAQFEVRDELIENIFERYPGVQLLVTEERLKAYILRDFSRGDIPFFSRIGDTIYYGVGQHPIAQLGGG